MLDTRFENPKTNTRYIVQWVTNHEEGRLRVAGYCVRDTGSSNWATLFQHKDKAVCEKVREMLNEGDNKC
jgi:hypothetical protein